MKELIKHLASSEGGSASGGKKAEKKIVKATPALENPKMMDERLYELEADTVRAEGHHRERRGVMKAINAFLKTPPGKTLQMHLLGGALFLSATSNSEQMLNPRTSRADIYATHPAEDVEEMRDELTEWLGAEQVRSLIPMETHEEIRQARREMRDASLLEIGPGFEEHEISPEIMRNYLEGGFPRFMVSSQQIASLDLTAEHRPMRSDYHLPPETEMAGTCSVAPAAETSEIRVYGSMFDEDGRLEIVSTFGNVIIHELGHGIDVTNLAGLDSERRIAMLHQMAEHVGNENEHLRFPYIEAIHHDDAQVQLRNRMTEYYAEFVSSMFRNTPTIYRASEGAYHEVSSPVEATADRMMEAFADADAMPQKDALLLYEAVRDDVRMIRDLIHELDPTFDWAAAQSAREDAMYAMETGRVTTAIRHQIAQIEDVVVRDELERRFEMSLEAEPVVEDLATFAQYAGTDRAYSNDLGELRGIEPELPLEARRLEQRVRQVQEYGLREARAELSPIDYAALGRLTALMETLAQTPTDQLSESMVQMMVADYRQAAEHATPAHRDAAFREMEINEGTSLSSDLRSQIATLLRRVEEDFESNDQG